MYEEISFVLRCFPFDKLLDICLQKGSVFCICKRACSLSAGGDFGEGSVASETSGMTSSYEVEMSGDGHWWVWLLVLKAGPSVFVADNTLTATGLSSQ